MDVLSGLVWSAGVEVESLKWHIGRKNQHMNQGAKTTAPEPANMAVSCHLVTIVEELGCEKCSSQGFTDQLTGSSVIVISKSIMSHEHETPIIRWKLEPFTITIYHPRSFFCKFNSEKLPSQPNRKPDRLAALLGDEKTWMDRPHIRFIGETLGWWYFGMHKTNWSAVFGLKLWLRIVTRPLAAVVFFTWFLNFFLHFGSCGQVTTLE